MCVGATRVAAEARRYTKRVSKMSKYISYAEDGETPIAEFDAVKENPDFYAMLRRAGDIVKELNAINEAVPQHAPNVIKSLLFFFTYLKQLNDSEANLQQIYSKNVKSILHEMKNFVLNPNLTVTIGAFSAEFHNDALSQTRLLVDDIERIYDRVLNRCIIMRADLFARLSIGLAILSIVLGIVGIAGLIG